MEKHKCKDCQHCDIKDLKCHPNSRDCHSEYKLDKVDLDTEARCDFFMQKSST